MGTGLGTLLRKLIAQYHNYPMNMSFVYRDIHTRRFMAKAVDDGAIFINDYREYLDFAATHFQRYAAANAIPADRIACLEFGVAGGISINRLSHALADYPFFGFDSFDGFLDDPDKSSVWAPFQKRFRNQVPPQVNENVRLVKGHVETTFLPFAQQALENKDTFFVHLDMDVYAPTKMVLQWLIASGKRSFVLFDEFINYSEFHLHEYRAFLETVIEEKVPYRVRALCDRGADDYERFGRVFLELH